MIARAKSVAARSWSCSKRLNPQSRPGYDLHATENMLESWANRRKNVRLVAEVVVDRQGKISRIPNLRFQTIDRTNSRRWQGLIVRSVARCYDLSCDRAQDATIDRTIGRRPSRLLVHRSFIATTSRMLLEIVANIADRSHIGPITTNRTIQKSYDPV